MHLEVDLRPEGQGISGYVSVTSERGRQSARLTDAPPASVVASIVWIFEQIAEQLTPEETELLNALGDSFRDDDD